MHIQNIFIGFASDDSKDKKTKTSRKRKKEEKEESSEEGEVIVKMCLCELFLIYLHFVFQTFYYTCKNS
jgi:hypothetical protein